MVRGLTPDEELVRSNEERSVSEIIYVIDGLTNGGCITDLHRNVMEMDNVVGR